MNVVDVDSDWLLRTGISCIRINHTSECALLTPALIGHSTLKLRISFTSEQKTERSALLERIFAHKMAKTKVLFAAGFSPQCRGKCWVFTSLENTSSSLDNCLKLFTGLAEI